MKRLAVKKSVSLILFAAMIVMSVAGCGKNKNTADGATKAFTFTVVDREAKETVFNIKTDKATVGEALIDEKLIEGENGAYGLYVTKVNGVEAKYEVDGTYWAFYINGEYAMTGVDSTKVEDGASYMFKVEGN